MLQIVGVELEKLSQLKAENLVFKKEKSPLNTVGKKWRRFQICVWPMQLLDTHFGRDNATRLAQQLNTEPDERTGVAVKNHVNTTEDDDDSNSDTDMEMQESAAVKKSEKMVYLEEFFFKKFEAFRSMIKGFLVSPLTLEEVLLIPTLTLLSWARCLWLRCRENLLSWIWECAMEPVIQTTMCKGISSILTRPTLQWYHLNLPNQSIYSVTALIDQCVEQFARNINVEKTATIYRRSSNIQLNPFFARYHISIKKRYPSSDVTPQQLSPPSREFYCLMATWAGEISMQIHRGRIVPAMGTI